MSTDHLPRRTSAENRKAVQRAAGRPGHDSLRPLGSMVAAAKTISSRTIKRTTAQRWQDDAWAMYDEVGELRFVANALASAGSRSRLFAAKLPHGADDPVPIEEEGATADDRAAEEVVQLLGGNVLARSELIRRLLVQMFVPGDGFLVGIPEGVLETGAPTATDDALPGMIGPEGEAETLTLDQLDWHAMSVSEVTLRSGKVVLNVGDGSPIELDEDQVMLVRVWRPHPRRWWQADSPVRSNLPILRELVGLTKHVGASIDSRLAGAGLLIVGQSVEVVGVGDPDGDPESPAPSFVDALVEAMTTALEDRDSAASVVPLVIKVPDDAVDKIRHITFSTPFDEHARELRDEAIRRLALGLDAPPEVLLGLGSSNHWSAWQIDEATTKTHIEPTLALLCDALTTEYLWPALRAAGVTNWRDYVVWFDTTELTLRPNRTQEATTGHEKGLLSDEAWRREAGFGETDAPDRTPPSAAVEVVMSIAKGAPQLIAENPAIVAQLLAVFEDLLAGNPVEDGVAGVDDDGGSGDPPPSGTAIPDTRGDVPDAPTAGPVAASALRMPATSNGARRA